MKGSPRGPGGCDNERAGVPCLRAQAHRQIARAKAQRGKLHAGIDMADGAKAKDASTRPGIYRVHI